MDSPELARDYFYLANVYESLNKDMLKDVILYCLLKEHLLGSEDAWIFVFPLPHLCDFRQVT